MKNGKSPARLGSSLLASSVSTFIRVSRGAIQSPGCLRISIAGTTVSVSVLSCNENFAGCLSYSHSFLLSLLPDPYTLNPYTLTPNPQPKYISLHQIKLLKSYVKAYTLSSLHQIKPLKSHVKACTLSSKPSSIPTLDLAGSEDVNIFRK